MSKNYNATDMKNIVMDMVSLGLGHLMVIREHLIKLDVQEKDFHDDTDKSRKAQLLITAAKAINDILHPAHELALQLFKDEESRSRIKGYQQIFKKNKQGECPCYSCKKEPNESTSGNTDTAQ